MICSNARRGVSRRLFSTASNSASKRSTDGYAWSNLYDEAYHMMMAAYVSYPLSFLLREAESGRFKHSKEFCQKLEMIHDGDISTALHPNDIVDLIQNNREYIEQHYTGKTGKTNLDDSFGWFRMLQQYSKMAGGDDPYNVSLLEFDDHHDEYRLAYGIGINK